MKTSDVTEDDIDRILMEAHEVLDELRASATAGGKARYSNSTD